MTDTVLIVDDERGIRETLGAVLEDEGFETEAVGGLGTPRTGTVGAVTVATGGSSLGSDRVLTGGTLTAGTGTGIDGTATLGVATGSSTATAGAAAKATQSTTAVKPSTRIPPLKCRIGARASG